MRQAQAAKSAQIAADVATTWLTWWWLGVRSLGSRPLARDLASNPLLPRPLLWWLAPRRWDVRAAVAANPRCPRFLMRLMTMSDWLAIDVALAGNPRASQRLLDYLIRAAGPCVRLSVAANPALSPALAARLLSDKNPYVRGVAAAHPALPADALTTMADGMAQPAWILKRIATNPSCPSSLSDQLLAWITLGGTGDADPAFDPVECTGHPGDTSIPAITWYRKAAGEHDAESHPLWRVRASVLGAAGKLPRSRAWALARDPRPEVRRSIAGAQRLPLDIRMELRRDADPAVVRLASAAGQKNTGQPRTARHVLRFVVVLFLLATPALYLLNPLRDPATSQLGDTFTRTLPGGGSLTCEADAGQPFIAVHAGDRRLTVRMTGVVPTITGQAPARSEATLPPGGNADYQLFGPSPVTVTAPADGVNPQEVVSVGRCGR